MNFLLQFKFIHFSCPKFPFSSQYMFYNVRKLFVILFAQPGFKISSTIHRNSNQTFNSLDEHFRKGTSRKHSVSNKNQSLPRRRTYWRSITDDQHFQDNFPFEEMLTCDIFHPDFKAPPPKASSTSLLLFSIIHTSLPPNTIQFTSSTSIIGYYTLCHALTVFLHSW